MVPRRMLLRPFAAVSLGLLLSTGLAQAAEGDWALLPVAGVRALKDVGPGPVLQLDLAHGLSEWWWLQGGVSASYHLGEPKPSVLGLGAGVAFRFDVLQWVPEASLRVQLHEVLGAGDAQFEMGPTLGLGLDYLISREWALGTGAQGHLLLTTDEPQAFAADGLLRLRYRWR